MSLIHDKYRYIYTNTNTETNIYTDTYTDTETNTDIYIQIYNINTNANICSSELYQLLPLGGFDKCIRVLMGDIHFTGTLNLF